LQRSAGQTLLQQLPSQQTMMRQQFEPSDLIQHDLASSVLSCAQHSSEDRDPAQQQMILTQQQYRQLGWSSSPLLRQQAVEMP
jgi:hypothetical protein